jgi:hypothetical protein
VADERARLEDEYTQRVSFLESELKQQKLAARNATLQARQQSPRRPAQGSSQLAVVKDNEDYFSTREERGVPRLTDLLGAVNAPQ